MRNLPTCKIPRLVFRPILQRVRPTARESHSFEMIYTYRSKKIGNSRGCGHFAIPRLYTRENQTCTCTSIPQNGVINERIKLNFPKNLCKIRWIWTVRVVKLFVISIHNFLASIWCAHLGMMPMASADSSLSTTARGYINKANGI